MAQGIPGHKIRLVPIARACVLADCVGGGFHMANEGSSNTAMVIIFLIVILAVAGFFVYRGGYFSEDKKVDINVNLPAVSVEK